MKNIPWINVALFSAVPALLWPASAGSAPTPPKPVVTPTVPAASKAVPLSFRDFFEPTPRELKLSQTLQQMNGKRVRITGFIAQMELPPKGGFFLCAMPVACDEAGGGTGDLPPETIRVIVRGAKDRVIQSIPRPVVVTGILEVGNRTEADGTVSAIRLILDRSQQSPAQPAIRLSKPAHNKFAHGTARAKS